MLDYILNNTLLIRIPHISKENLADERLRINRAQPVNIKVTSVSFEPINSRVLL